MPALPKSDFEFVRKNKVYEEVARQIERLILKKLKPGDKLPSERELAEMLQVSRSSIRDAIRGLELMGLVEPRQGAGTIVREISTDSLVNPFANALKRKQAMVGELLDFRKMLEPSLAARAAMHASADELGGDGGDSATAAGKAFARRIHYRRRCRISLQHRSGFGKQCGS